MAKQARKSRAYKFVALKQNEKGIVSLICGIISLIMFIVLVIVSCFMAGNAGIHIGTIGLSSIVFAIVGFIIGLLSFKEKDRNYLFSKIGSLFCFFVVLLWFMIYLIGSYSLWQ